MYSQAEKAHLRKTKMFLVIQKKNFPGQIFCFTNEKWIFSVQEEKLNYVAKYNDFSRKM